MLESGVFYRAGRYHFTQTGKQVPKGTVFDGRRGPASNDDEKGSVPFFWRGPASNDDEKGSVPFF